MLVSAWWSLRCYHEILYRVRVKESRRLTPPYLPKPLPSSLHRKSTSLLSTSSQKCWCRLSLEASALGLLTDQLGMDRNRTVGSKSVDTFSKHRSHFCGWTPEGQTQSASGNKRNVGEDYATSSSGNMLGKLRYCAQFVVNVTESTAVFMWVGIVWSLERLVTGWTVRGSNPGGWRIFPHLSRPALGPIQPSTQCILGHTWG
jgi:hypothetical protein